MTIQRLILTPITAIANKSNTAWLQPMFIKTEEISLIPIVEFQISKLAKGEKIKDSIILDGGKLFSYCITPNSEIIRICKQYIS